MIADSLPPLTRPDVVSKTPLQLPLNFRLTEEALRTPGEALLAAGDYTAIWQVVYAQKTRCDGCGRPKQAKELVIVRDNDTLEEQHVGLDCMEKLYGESAARLRQHAGDVRAARRGLLSKLRLKDDISTEEAIRRVRGMVLAHVPRPEPHLTLLDGIDTLTPNKHEQDQLARVQGLALYHREWQDDPDRARRRWSALSTHPRFLYSGPRNRVREACQRALHSGTQLPEDEIHQLNTWLAQAQTFDSPLRTMTRPEEYEGQEAYEAAVEEALALYMGVAVPQRVHWRPPFIPSPEDLVSVDRREGYAVVAVDPREVRRFKQRILEHRPYRKATQRPIVVVGPEQVHVDPAVYRRGRVDDREDQGNDESGSEILVPERRHRYVLVGWALAERYTPTHRAWRQWSRSALEFYL